MLFMVLGAPGAGKTALVPHLRSALPGYAVIDWDDFMPEVEALGGSDVRSSPVLWDPYRDLVRRIVVSLEQVPTVLFGVCTPEELVDWPPARWILLDCDDDERRRRLAARPSDQRDEAMADARKYRALRLPVLDTTGRTVDDVVNELVGLLAGS